MGAEAEPTQIRLVCVGDDDVATGSHVRKWMETRPIEGIEISVQFDVDLTAALEILENGEADLLAVSARNWYLSKGALGTIVAAALPRRDENHILVADDRENFLKPKAIILAQNKLQRRQLRRYRPDFRVLKPSAFAEHFSQKKPPSGGLALQSWMEDLKATKIIDGYVSEKHLVDGRTLSRIFKLTTEPKKDGVNRFLPSPLQGLTLLISRERFPKTMIEKIGDVDAYSAWICERVILDQIGPELFDYLGLIVRHRHIPSLLNQADDERDLLRSTELNENRKFFFEVSHPERTFNVRKSAEFSSKHGEVCIYTNGVKKSKRVYVTKEEAEGIKHEREQKINSERESNHEDKVELRVYRCEYDHIIEENKKRQQVHFHLTSKKDELIEKTEPSWVEKIWKPTIETMIEVVGRNGRKTVSIEKINLTTDIETHAILAAKSFSEAFSVVTMEHEEDIRLGSARPPFLDL